MIILLGIALFFFISWILQKKFNCTQGWSFVWSILIVSWVFYYGWMLFG